MDETKPVCDGVVPMEVPGEMDGDLKITYTYSVRFEVGLDVMSNSNPVYTALFHCGNVMALFSLGINKPVGGRGSFSFHFCAGITLTKPAQGLCKKG